MTTHPTSSTPAMAQHPAMLAIDNARTRMLEALRLLHERSVELERAALEAPARDAGREVCPQCKGKGTTTAQGYTEVDAQGRTHLGAPYEAPCGLCYQKSTPTEPPPPAWDQAALSEGEAFIGTQ
jgi:hypothetical protein